MLQILTCDRKLMMVNFEINYEVLDFRLETIENEATVESYSPLIINLQENIASINVF